MHADALHAGRPRPGSTDGPPRNSGPGYPSSSSVQFDNAVAGAFSEGADRNSWLGPAPPLTGRDAQRLTRRPDLPSPNLVVPAWTRPHHWSILPTSPRGSNPHISIRRRAEWDAVTPAETSHKVPAGARRNCAADFLGMDCSNSTDNCQRPLADAGEKFQGSARPSLRVGSGRLEEVHQTASVTTSFTESPARSAARREFPGRYVAQALRSEIIHPVGLTNSFCNGLVCSNDRRHIMAPRPTIYGISRAQDVDGSRAVLTRAAVRRRQPPARQARPENRHQHAVWDRTIEAILRTVCTAVIHRRRPRRIVPPLSDHQRPDHRAAASARRAARSTPGGCR